MQSLCFNSLALLNVLDFNISQIFQLHRHGIKLIEILSRDRYHFHVAVDVQLSHEDKCRAHALPPKDYVELIFQSWERSEQPTYPPTWEGLFTVLRKMDLGHLVEGIVKSVTGPTTDFEIESSPQVSEEDGPAEEKEIGHSYTSHDYCMCTCLLSLLKNVINRN